MKPSLPSTRTLSSKRDATLADGAHSTLKCTLDGVPRAAARIASSGIVLVQALGKGNKTEQVVRSATALGVAELHLVESARSVARAGDRADSKRARLESIALDAARQSLRGDVPLIVGPHAFDRELESWRERAGIKLCLVPGAPHTLRVLRTRKWTILARRSRSWLGPRAASRTMRIASAEQGRASWRRASVSSCCAPRSRASPRSVRYFYLGDS